MVKHGILSSYDFFIKDKRKYYLCRCECGGEKTVRADQLKGNINKSCGCLNWNRHEPDFTNEYLLGIYNKNRRSLSHWATTRIHNSWRSILFTEKGKKAGYPDEWKDFLKFADEVQDGYSPDKLLARRDVKIPHSKTNSRWVEKEDLQKRNSLTFSYKGSEKTLKELSEITGARPATILQRIRSGLSVEEAVYGKMRKRKIGKQVSTLDIDHKKKRLKASKMVSSYRMKDLKKGWNDTNVTIEFMIESIFPRPCTYCGVKGLSGCDRIDNDKPHVVDNCIPACKDCNQIRGNRFSVEEMKLIGGALNELVYSKRSKDK